MRTTDAQDLEDKLTVLLKNDMNITEIINVIIVGILGIFAGVDIITIFITKEKYASTK